MMTVSGFVIAFRGLVKFSPASSSSVSWQRALTTTAPAATRLREQAVALRPNKAKGTATSNRSFRDCVTVRVRGGNGGNGSISLLSLFANEFAGPAGGDGGNGGHVLFRQMDQTAAVFGCDRSMPAILLFPLRKVFGETEERIASRPLTFPPMYQKSLLTQAKWDY